MAEPQLTIVVAAPNASPTLGECLDALASQVTGRESEVLVTAATSAGVQLVRERFPQFTAIEAPVSGGAASVGRLAAGTWDKPVRWRRWI